MTSTRSAMAGPALSPPSDHPYIHDSDDFFSYPPPKPNPSLDTGLASRNDQTTPPSSPNIGDVFTIGPVTALKLLCAGVEALVKITGDVPPTPPPSVDTPPNMRGMAEEKENIIRSNSYKNLQELNKLQRARPSNYNSPRREDEIDGVSFKKRSRSPPLRLRSPEIKPVEPYIIIGDNAEPLNVQHSAITRKFFSKCPPPISLEDYLMRIHQYCPMSTAVYLATSSYIHKLAVDDRAIAVTRRNCHRLVLAGLRVAMKALEDLSYPHSRFSKVGGVGENELARLEISFCFLTNFDFKTSKDKLLAHAVDLREYSQLQGAVGFVPKMPLSKRSIVKVERVVDVVMTES